MITATLKPLDRDEGSTLVELFVVVVIIGILAAIAIPNFLNQRQLGWNAATQAALNSAGLFQEVHFTDNDTYAAAVDPTLLAEGFRPTEDVTVTVVDGDSDFFCMSAVHSSQPGTVHYLSSVNRRPQSTTPCVAD